AHQPRAGVVRRGMSRRSWARAGDIICDGRVARRIFQNKDWSMARKIRPPAELKPRDGDEELGIEQLKQIALFKDINLERLELDGFPGTLVLRRFRKGEVICRQNDPGYTAFYILTNKDFVELRESQLNALTTENNAR